jgi:hypothetical protein
VALPLEEHASKVQLYSLIFNFIVGKEFEKKYLKRLFRGVVKKKRIKRHWAKHLNSKTMDRADTTHQIIHVIPSGIAVKESVFKIFAVELINSVTLSHFLLEI